MERSSFNQMVRFFLRLLLILSLILLFDYSIGMILKHFYSQMKHGEKSQITYTIDSTYADILIFGSSRATHSYNPEIFESRLPYTCYIAGKDGSFILYNYAIFKAIVKRYNPKLIIFDIRPYDIEYHLFEYERLSLLLPYYLTHPEIRNIIDLRGPFEKIKHYSAIYFYNSLILQIARGNLELNNESESDLKGYIPLNGTMEDAKIGAWEITNCNIDENKIHALEDIVSTCKQKNIDLMFVNSPSWILNKESDCNSLISAMCSENDIRYLDMSNDSTFIANPKFFKDKNHLNSEGAKVFSNMIVNKLWLNLQ
jgi:hypothetical protein